MKKDLYTPEQIAKALKDLEKKICCQSASQTPLFPLVGTGTASGDVIGDINSNFLRINEGGQTLMIFSPVDGGSSLFSLNGQNIITVSDDIDGINLLAGTSTIDMNDGGNNITYTTGLHTFNGDIQITVPAEYADDAAASVGGIAVGGIYRTGSILKVRVA